MFIHEYDTSNTPSNIILKLKDTGNLTDEEWKVVLQIGKMS